MYSRRRINNPCELAVRQEKRLTEGKARQDPPQWLILLKIQDTNTAMAVYVGKALLLPLQTTYLT